MSVYVVAAPDAFSRLDEFVQRQEHSLPLTVIRQAVEKGDVLVNGNARTAGWRLRVGDRISANLAEYLDRGLEAETVALEILYEDEFLIAVNKPPRMLSHPSGRERTGTLLNALLGYVQQGRGQHPARMWPGLVHRLDRDTSGIIVAARQERALEKLFEAFRERQVRKVYQALVFGLPTPAAGVIDAPIGRHPALWPRWRIMDEGKPAQTEYLVKEQAGHFSLVELEPRTGRTHQLRIHLAHLGHPIVGDHTYGRALNKQLQQEHPEHPVARQLLHAARLSFRHPMTRAQVELQAPLPDDMREFFDFAPSIG